MSRACLITLVAFAVISCAAASRILEDDAAATGRSLLATANRYICSTHCAPNQCIRVGTTGLTKCNRCKNNMKPILSGVNMGQCGCPAGTYFNKNAPEVITGDGVGNCIPCEFGYYCNKQLTWVANGEQGTTVGRTQCAAHLTTRARRSTSVWDCVNMGGYYQNNTATGPVATACTGNTYAIAKSKQSACTPCPAGMQVNETDTRDKPSSCKVPPGYFMKSPGQIAPCDQGSYQPLALSADQADAGACTPCPEGVTTKDHASTVVGDCKYVKPGYVATDSASDTTGVTAAVLCPQGYYCPGSVRADEARATAVSITALTTDDYGNLNGTTYISPATGDLGDSGTAKMVACPNSAWTRTVGATSLDQCVIPPGFELTGANIALCGNGAYRAEWVSIAASASVRKCVACGTDIAAEAIEPITLYSLNTTVEAGANTDYNVVNIKVKASSKSCYIVKGQGMYYVANGTTKGYKARDCGITGGVANSYGVTGDKVYGLAQTPCKLCPAGTQVDATQSPSKDLKATNGFYNPLACVTKVGYGWDGRVASLCAKGWFNPGNNYQACTQCAYGMTTLDPLTDGTATNGTEDCLAAPGFGLYDAKMQLCPAGFYNDEVRAPAICKTCPDNSWTAEEGSDALSDCSVCQPGYGDTPGSLATNVTEACKAKTCGGNTVAGTYGPADRENLACVACPTSVVGFQFWYDGNNYNYTSPARAVAGAQDAAECVAGMAQIEDGLFFLSSKADIATAVAAADITACANICLDDLLCVLATYNYNATGDKCQTLSISEASNDTIVTAMKAVPSSDVSQSRKLQAAKPKAVSTGMYTQWWYDGMTNLIGTQVDAIPAVTSKAECFDACDAQDNCAGVVYQKGDNICKIITGANTPDGAGAAKRTLTRALPGYFARS